jgi:hypothetical protein
MIRTRKNKLKRHSEEPSTRSSIYAGNGNFREPRKWKECLRRINLRKYPDEAYGDTEIPHRGRALDRVKEYSPYARFLTGRETAGHPRNPFPWRCPLGTPPIHLDTSLLPNMASGTIASRRNMDARPETDIIPAHLSTLIVGLSPKSVVTRSNSRTTLSKNLTY